jgi:hypothetical protein
MISGTPSGSPPGPVMSCAQACGPPPTGKVHLIAGWVMLPFATDDGTRLVRCMS